MTDAPTPEPTTPPEPEPVPDAGTAAQQAAEAHLAAVCDAEDAADQGLDVDSPASAPFDGCETCVVREVLYAAWPVFEADVVTRLRQAGFADAADHLTGPDCQDR